METTCINAFGYDNILLRGDQKLLRVSIHSDNGHLSTKLSLAQVQTLINALQKVLNETAA